MSSPRIIHYTSAQMFWECEHFTLSENNTIMSVWDSIDPSVRSMFLSLYRSIVPEPPDVLTNWYSALVQSRYSTCSLTFKQDKLVAIAGLVKLVHDRTAMPYFAGRWYDDENSFLDSLNWPRASAGTKDSGIPRAVMVVGFPGLSRHFLSIIGPRRRASLPHRASLCNAEASRNDCVRLAF
jgi:hypothetical protein